jgi:hypothetical protein
MKDRRTTRWTGFARRAWPLGLKHRGEHGCGTSVAALWTPPGSGRVGAGRPCSRTVSKHADIVPSCHTALPDPSPSPEKLSVAATPTGTVPPVRPQNRRRSSSSPRAVSSRIQCFCLLPSLRPAPRRPARRPCASGVAMSPPIQRTRRASPPSYK